MVKIVEFQVTRNVEISIGLIKLFEYCLQNYFARREAWITDGSIAERNTSGRHNCTMTCKTRMHLLLLSELVSAFRANDSETSRRWISGGIQDLGEPAVEQLMME